MIMNHLNLTVSDVPAAKAFLEKYFGLVDIGGGNKNRAFLRDDRWLVPSMFKGKGRGLPRHVCYWLRAGERGQGRCDQRAA